MKNFDLEITKGLVRLLLFNKDITKNTSLSLSSLFKRQLFNLGSILFLVLGMSALAPAQTLYDSFGDGDFTASPVWGGNTNNWTVTSSSDAAAGAANSRTLRLVGSGTNGATEYLRSQISTWGTTQEWGFWIGRRAQSFTGTSTAYIWLYANENNLTSNTVDGYRLAIGDDTGDDEIVLQYIVNGTVSATVITSSGAITNGLTDIGFLLRVTRSSTGVWEMFTSTLPTANGNGAIATATPSSTNANVLQGTGTNNTLAISANGFLGVAALHTNGNNSNATMEVDQIYFSADPPQIALTTSALTLCRGTTSVTLPYTLTNSPTQYKIDYDATANTAGLADVAFTNLPGSSPLTLTIPAGISAGTYNGTITVRDGNGRTGSFQPFTVTVTLTSTTANAGADQSFCATSVTLAGSVGGTATTGTWTTNGTGMFGNANVLNTTYTPSSADITAGSVTLTLTSNDPGGACPGAASDQMILTTVATQSIIYTNVAAASTFVVPAGVTNITVQAWGAGGGGSGQSGSRYGGGGGAFATKSISTTAGTPYTVTIGEGGTGGGSNSNGTNGEASSFGTEVIADFGKGGTTTNGLGGLASASTPSATAKSGGNGGSGTGDGGGGGGGAATASLAGGIGQSVTGSTGGIGGKAGNAPNVGGATGAAGDGGNGGDNGNDGNDGILPGGGGGGRGRSGNNGGSGGNGQVVVSWPCNCVDLSNLTTTATTPICTGGVTTVTIASTTLANGTYTIYYVLSGTNTSAPTLATLNFSAGTGTFTASGFSNAGNTTITVHAIGCNVPPIGVDNAATVSVTASPTLTLGTFPTVCSGVASANLPYSATTGTPNAYTIDYDADANTAGFTDILSFTNFTFGSSGNLALAVPTGVNAVPGTYNGSLTVRNNTTLCTSTYAFTVTIAPLPTITLDASPVICRGITTANLAYSAVSGSPIKYSIAYSGPVVLSSGVALTNLPASPIVLSVPSNAVPGTYNATITVQNASLCNSSATGFTVEILDAAIANAGVDQTKCYSTPNVTLAGSISGTATSGTWTTNGGDGTFSPDNNFATATTYIPGPTDISNGTVTLILTTDDPGGICPGAGVDQMVVTIAPLPTANAGMDFSICSGNTATLSGIVGGSATGGTWSSSTGGTFNNANSLNAAVYTPSTADRNAGSVVLTLTTTGGVCPSPGTDQITITINPLPSITLGTLASTCRGTTVQLPYTNPTNSPTLYSISYGGAQNFVSVTNAALPANNIPIVIPTTSSATNVTATITVTNANGCVSTSQTYVFTLTSPPTTPTITGSGTNVCPNTAGLTYSITAVAGATYAWSVPTGWNITNGATTNAITVTAGASASNGNISVTVTNPCGSSTGSFAVIGNSNDIGFGDVSVDAYTTCAGVAPPVLTAANPDGGDTRLWQVSINGGAFGTAAGTSNNVTYTVNSTYFNTAGTYQFRRVITNSSFCNNTSNPITLTVAAATPPSIIGLSTPTVCLGANTVSIPFTSTVNDPTTYSINFVSNSITDITNATLPSAPGNITFSIPTNLAAATYTGVLTLRTATGCTSTGTINVSFIVSNTQGPSANAGADLSVCSNTPFVELTGASIGGAATSGTWTTSGNGSFANINGVPDNSTNAVYYVKGSNDNTSVTLTLTTNVVATCGAATDSKVITYVAPPTLNVGNDQTICITANSVSIPVTSTGTITSASWGTTITQTNTASGPFPANVTTFPTTSTYNLTVADKDKSSIILRLFTDVTTGVCTGIYEDEVEIFIQREPIVYAGPDQTICPNGTATLAGTKGGGATGAIWSGGAGNFDPNNTTLNTVYTPSAGEITAGSANLTLTTTGSVCPAVMDNVTITIEDKVAPVLSAANESSTVSCLANAVPPTVPTASDNCDLTVNGSLVSIVDNPSTITCEGTRVYTYSYTDASGNTATTNWVYTYTIDYSGGLTAPSNETETVSCPADAIVPVAPADIKDACGRTVSAVLIGRDAPLPECEESTVVWRYRYTACDGTTTADWTKTYTIDYSGGLTAPSNETETVSCPADAVVPVAPADIKDACGRTVSAVLIGRDAPLPECEESTVVWRYRYTACDGTTTADWTKTYTIDYSGGLTAPSNETETVSCPADAVVPVAPADIKDACGRTVSAVLIGRDAPLPECEESTVVWRYRYTACDGTTTADWTKTYTIDYSGGLTAPSNETETVSCPADAVVPVAPADIKDACGRTVSAVLIGRDAPLPECEESTVVWRYRYTACDGTTTADWTKTYTIDYSGGLTAPSNETETVSCPADAVVPVAPADIKDACGRTVSAVLIGRDAPLPECEESTVVWRYRYTACDGTTTADWTKTYTIDYSGGLTAPSNETETVSCPADAVVPVAPADIKDACGRTVSAVLIGRDAPLPECEESTVVWRYRYTACDGTTTADWTKTYTIDYSGGLTAPSNETETVSCPADAVVPVAPADIKDACGRTVSAVLIGRDAPLPECEESTVVWRYRYTACDGTTTADWTKTYTIDYSGGLTAPSNETETVSCPADAVVPVAPADIKDACGRTVSAVLIGRDAPLPECEESTVVWRYRYTACDGTTTADWTKTYTIDYSGGLIAPDNETETVSCPADAVDPGVPADITDACGRTVKAKLVGQDASSPECEGTVVWRYRYTACDNTTTVDWTYTYTIDYSGGLIAPDNETETVSCPADAVDPGVPADITDACGRTVKAKLVGQDASSPECEGTVVWRYRYTACDNTTTVDWTYTYTIDYSGGLIAPDNETETVSCPADAVDPGVPADITDACGRTVKAKLVGQDASSPECEGTVVWRYRYTACDNTTTVDWTYTYTIDYSGGLIAPDNETETVSCAAADAVDPGAPADITDACGRTVKAKLVGQDAPSSECEGTVVWRYRYTACDNTTTVDWTYTYTIDYSGGLIAPDNETETVSCPADAVDPGVPADITDACGRTVKAKLVGQDASSPGCEGTVVWRYRYTACDNTTTVDWTYTYTIDYSGGLIAPDNETETVSCPADAVDPGKPADIKDACGRTVGAALVGQDAVSPECEGTVVWRYRYTACDNTTTADWTYTYTIDYSGGLIAPDNETETVSCPADAVDPGVPADITDACGRTVKAKLVGQDASSPECEGTVVWRYRYTACDNTTTVDWTYTYTIDYSGGLIAPDNETETVSCPADAVDPGVPADITDACGRTVKAKLVGQDASSPGCEGTVVWRYRYTACDNTTTVDWTYTYTIDYSGGLIAPDNETETVSCPADAVDPGVPADITDACGRTVKAKLVGQDASSPECEGTVVWRYRYTACDNTTTVDWTYTYTIDYSGGLIAPDNETETVSCPADAVDPGVPADITDACGRTVKAKLVGQDASSPECEGTVVWRYRYTACDNTTTVDWTYTYTIDYSGGLIAPDNETETVSCPADAVDPGVPADITDACGRTVKAKLVGQDASSPECEGTVVWRYRYTACDNTTTVDWTYTYTIDYSGGLIAPDNETETVSCPADAVDPGVPADITDACGRTVKAKLVGQDASSPECEGTVVWRYRYTACDNTTTVDWTYTYTIDYSGGLIAPDNETETVSCPADAVDPGKPADIKDACGRTVGAALVGQDAVSPECEGTVVWRYRYTACDNTTTVDWTYTYTIDYSGGLIAPDNETETVSCPADAVDPGVPADITDACGRTVKAKLVGQDASSPECEGTVVWRYRYTACDNTTTADWTYTYTIDYSGGLIAPDNETETVSCPADAVDPGVPADITDACGRTVKAKLVGQDASSPECEGTVVWRYRYTACDNTTTVDWTYTYTIDYSGGLIAPDNETETVSCPADAVDPGKPADITDACGRTVKAKLVGQDASSPGCEGTVVWRYRYTACDNTTTVDWTYTYTIDYSGGLIAPDNETETVSCPADAVDPGVPADITDACGRTVKAKLVGQDASSPECEGTVVWRYRYTACDNTTTVDWTYTYTIDYSGGLIAPDNETETVSCPADAVDPGVPADITDACGRTVKAKLVGQDASSPECEGTVVWRYRYTACDNTTTADWTYTYTIDYSGGLIAPDNETETVSCPADAVDPGVPADITDACGRTVGAALVGQDASSPGCEGTVVWRYRYTACDNTTTVDWTYTYTIDYSGGLIAPDNETETVSCPADAVDPGKPADITDACGRTVKAKLVGQDASSPGCEGTVVWRYRYTACDNTTTVDWTYTYTIDYSGGLIAPDNETETVSCPADAVDPGVPADITDACGRTVKAKLVGQDASSPECEGTVVWRYRYTACDNTTTVDWTYTYTIDDNTAPKVVSTNSSNSLDVNDYKCGDKFSFSAESTSCFTIKTIAKPTWSDNCTGIVVSKASADNGVLLTELQDHVTGEFPVGVTTVTFTGTDCAGNASTCSLTITIIDDTAPIAVCKNITVNLDQNGTASITPAEVDNGSTDNCTIVEYLLSKTSFSCSDVGKQTVTLTVKDAAGLADQCTVEVTVIASQACKVIIANTDGPSIADPCSCSSVADYFDEEIVITGNSNGEAWVLSANSGFINPNTGLPYPVNTPFVSIGNNRYSLVGRHKSGDGFNVSATSIYYPGVTLSINNKCYYPDPSIAGLPTLISPTAVPFVVTGNVANNAAGTGTFILNGNTQAGAGSAPTLLTINPATLPLGNNTLKYSFDAGKAGSNNINDPGCVKVVTQTFRIANCGCQDVTVTLGPDCKFNLTGDLVSDGNCNGGIVRVMDGNPNNGGIIDCPGVWTYGLFDGFGNIICWGKVTAEDKTAPAIVCKDWYKGTLNCYDVSYVLNNSKTIGSVVGTTSSPRPSATSAQTIPNAEGVKGEGACNLVPPSLVADNINNLGYTYFADNCRDCGCRTTVKWSDKVVFYSCEETAKNGGIYARISRQWTATDCNGYRKDTIQEIPFARPALKDFTFNGLGDDEYDRVVTYNACSPDKSLIKYEDVTPFVDSYFYTEDNKRRIYLDKIECNYSVSIKDTEFPICNGKGVKIDRELNVLDWCAGGIVKTYHILIKIGDFEAPTMSIPAVVNGAPYNNPAQLPLVKISTGPMDCTAAFPISTAAAIKNTFGYEIKDNCTLANVSVSVYTKDTYIKGILVYQGPKDAFADCKEDDRPKGFTRPGDDDDDHGHGGYFPKCENKCIAWKKVDYAIVNGNMVGVPVGRHLMVIEAFDGCYNSSCMAFEFAVEDKIAPVMKCDDKLNISLSNGNGYTTGYAQASAEDVDEGSWDNCKLAWIKVRRNVPDACKASFIAKGYDTNNDGDLTIADGFDTNGDGNSTDSDQDGIDDDDDGKIDEDFGELFILKGGKLMTPLQDKVEFFCCDLTEKVTVELWGADASGNTNFCWMELAIEDKVAPYCAAPWDITVDCDEKCLETIDDKKASVACFGDVTITSGNDCAPMDTVYSTEKKLRCGAGYIDRIWTLTKQTTKGPITITCKQRVYINAIHEYNIVFPKDASFDCKTPIVDTVLTDELGCDILAVNVSDKRYDASNDECYKLFRTYTVINWCVYDDRCGDPMAERNVFVVNRATFDNYGKAPIYLLVRDENRNLNEEFYLSKDSIPNNADDERFFPAKCTATDEYYHAFQYTQIIKVYDSERPVVSGVRDTFCTSPTACTGNITKVVTIKDNCTDKVELERQSLMIAPNQTLDASKMITYSTTGWSAKDLGNGQFEIKVSNLPEGTHDLIVVGRDECGNLSLPTRIPFVVKDCKAPAPICINGLSVDLMPDGNDGGMMTVWATDFVASKIYDCNGQGPETKDGLKLVTKYSVNRVKEAVVPTQTSISVNCADLELGFILVELHAWDEAGNHDFCVTFVEVQDNNKVCPAADPLAGEITGLVTTDDTEPVQGVDVDMSGGAQLKRSTAVNGGFSFTGLKKGTDYTVAAQLDKDHLNGVSTLDLILIQKHILGIKAITSPYRLIAADVNNSKSISTIDLIQIRKLILNIENRFNNVPSWKFVDAAYRFPEAGNPWTEAYPEVVNINDLDGKVQANFIAVKMGDINGNAATNGAVASEIRGAKEMILTTEEQNLKAGQSYSIAIKAKDLANIQGYQFTLEVDPSLAQIEGIDYTGLMKAENFGVFARNGQITASYHSTTSLPGAPSGEAVLFTLKLKAESNIKLSEVLDISNRLTHVEAYNLNDEVMGVKLTLDNFLADEKAALYQNTPNPFSDETSIGFYLPKATEALLTVRDVKGALIYQVKGSYAKGQSKVVLTQEQLRTPGVLYYTLETSDFIATKKMVIVGK